MKDAESLFEQGVTFLNHGRYTEAEQAFRKVIELFPDGTSAWVNHQLTVRTIDIDTEDEPCEYPNPL